MSMYSDTSIVVIKRNTNTHRSHRGNKSCYCKSKWVRCSHLPRFVCNIITIEIWKQIKKMASKLKKKEEKPLKVLFQQSQFKPESFEHSPFFMFFTHKFPFHFYFLLNVFELLTLTFSAFARFLFGCFVHFVLEFSFWSFSNVESVACTSFA